MYAPSAHNNTQHEDVLRASASGLLRCDIKYASEAEISQLGDGTGVTCKQDVFRLYIPMENSSSSCCADTTGDERESA